jgi:hypothetical protein
MSNRWINCDDALVPMLSKLCHVNVAEGMRAVMEFDGQIPKAGMLYDEYNGYSIRVHMWVDEGYSPSRWWWWAIHDYPVNQLGVSKVFAMVPSSRPDALNISKRVGFREIHVVQDYYGPDENLHIFERLPSEGFDWRRVKPKVYLQKAA